MVILQLSMNCWNFKRLGDTALISAAESGHLEIVNVLINAGADIEAKEL